MIIINRIHCSYTKWTLFSRSPGYWIVGRSIYYNNLRSKLINAEPAVILFWKFYTFIHGSRGKTHIKVEAIISSVYYVRSKEIVRNCKTDNSRIINRININQVTGDFSFSGNLRLITNIIGNWSNNNICIYSGIINYLSSEGYGSNTI